MLPSLPTGVCNPLTRLHFDVALLVAAQCGTSYDAIIHVLSEAVSVPNNFERLPRVHVEVAQRRIHRSGALDLPTRHPGTIFVDVRHNFLLEPGERGAESHPLECPRRVVYEVLRDFDSVEKVAVDGRKG